MASLELIKKVDDAWNERRWDDYAAHIHADFKAYANDSPDPHDRSRHIQRAIEFCELYPDATVHEPYLEAFEGADGTMTCTVARLTGKAAETAATFDITMAVIIRWEAGQMIEQRQFIDEVRMAGQLAAST